MATQEEFWRTADHLQLHALGWFPVSKPKGVVVLVHGVGEHIGRYRHVGERLNRVGYGVCGFDLRGHGKSGGRRGDVPHIDRLLEDIDVYVLRIREQYPDIPVFIYGHSLGAVLVLRYAIGYRPPVIGIIVTCPGLRPASIEKSAWKTPLARLLCRAAPGLMVANGVRPEDLSRIQSVVRSYRADPLVYERISLRFAIGILDMGAWVIRHSEDLHYPLLFLQGGADRVVDVPTNLAFAKAVGEQCELKVWPELYHELHNEPENEEVFAAVEAWLIDQSGQSTVNAQ